MPKLGIPRENFAFVSGIGCSSRFPYYVQTYGLHTIHGRALAIATGLKVTRPDLSVWVVTGDGDALAIGGNHFIHAVRRNIGLKIILLNNRIYGLTKGQYSPTSELGKKTKTSPLGNIDQPFSPVALALGAGATFAARCIDSDQAMMAAILERAAKHEGTAFVEILQNCVVFNDGAFDTISDKATRDDTRLLMEHGKPLIFGKERNKGIRLSGMDMEVATIGENGVTEADILVHNENAAHSGSAFSLGQFELPDFPIPFGVFRDIDKPSYESLSKQLSESARAAKGPGDLARLLNSGDTWTIK
jgi:2-oxoglutarate ferredoxin oxidoreductase subunit beta